jgi:hypothetical protein
MEVSHVRWCGCDDRRSVPQPARAGGSSSIDHTLLGDTDNDGDVNASSSTDDTDQIQTWISTSTDDVRGDLNLNGDVHLTGVRPDRMVS